MHDDAKFLFFLCGFSGFLFFYLISIFVDADPVIALIKGALGCLVLGSLGRFILGFALKQSSSSNRSVAKMVEGDLGESRAKKSRASSSSEQSLDELAAATNLEALSKSKVASSLKVNH